MSAYDPFRKTLEEKLKLTQWITQEIRKIQGVEIVFAPQTAIVGFRYFDSKKSLTELNQINRDLLETINSDGRILLSSIELGGKFTIRIIPFGQRTHYKQVRIAKSLIKGAIAKIT